MPLNFCPNCATKLKASDTEICPKCGVRLNKEKQSSSTIQSSNSSSEEVFELNTSKPRNKKLDKSENLGKTPPEKKVNGFIIIIVISLIIIGISALWVINQINANNANKPKEVDISVARIEDKNDKYGGYSGIIFTFQGGKDADLVSRIWCSHESSRGREMTKIGDSVSFTRTNDCTQCDYGNVGKTSVHCWAEFTDGSSGWVFDNQHF